MKLIVKKIYSGGQGYHYILLENENGEIYKYKISNLMYVELKRLGVKTNYGK